MKKAWLLLLILVAVFGFSGSAGASLTLIGTAEYGDIDYNLIYMDDGPFGPVTWLDYTNSRTTWQNQVDWASNLSFTDADIQLNPGYTTNIDWSTGWRLPATVDGPSVWGYDGTTTAGYNITTSEMGYLYYEALGNKGYYDTSGASQPGWGLNNKGDFNYLQAGGYWSGTEYSPGPFGAWHFVFGYGYQDYDFKGFGYYALAVRPGDVSAVPIPGAVWLLGSGLLGFVGFRKKFKKS